MGSFSETYNVVLIDFCRHLQHQRPWMEEVCLNGVHGVSAPVIRSQPGLEAAPIPLQHLEGDHAQGIKRKISFVVILIAVSIMELS